MAKEFFNWQEVDPAWADPQPQEQSNLPVATNGNVPSVYQISQVPSAPGQQQLPIIIQQQMPNNSGSLVEKVVVLAMLAVIFIGGAVVLVPLLTAMIASLAVILAVAVVALGVGVVGIKALMDGMNGHATGPRPTDTGSNNLPTMHRRR